MAAVVEPASRRERLDVGERLLEPFVGIPQPDRTQPGCIDEDCAGRKQHQLPRDGRVPAALIALPHRARREQLGTGQAIDQRRLPRTRRANERDRVPRFHRRLETVEPRAGDRAHRVNGHVADGVAHRFEPRLLVVDEIDLGHHHHRPGTGVVDDDELALEPAGPQRCIEGVHEEHAVDIGRDHLRALRDRGVAPAVARAAHERAPSRQQRRELTGTDHHPVADGRTRQRIAIPTEQRNACPHTPLTHEHRDPTTVDSPDAADDIVRFRQRGGLDRARIVPTEPREPGVVHLTDPPGH